jgi:hypothetical protein
LLMLCHSLFLSFLPRVPWSCSTVTDMFCIWVCARSCLVLCTCLSFASVFHVWEKTHGLCLSEPGLLHLTRCPPVASIHLQTTCHCSLRLKETPLCIWTTFSWSIHQLGCFHSLAIVNGTVMSTSVQVSPLYPDLCFFGQRPRSSITGSYGRQLYAIIKQVLLSLEPHLQSILLWLLWR